MTTENPWKGTTTNNFATAVKRSRLGSGKTQGAMAALAGISRSYWRYIETGERIPPMATAQRVAEAVGLDPAAAEEAVMHDRAAAGAQRVRIPADVRQALRHRQILIKAVRTLAAMNDDEIQSTLHTVADGFGD